MRQDKEPFIAAQLARIALHYYRPDVAAVHAKAIVQDFVEDLHEYEMQDIAEAFRAYRRNAENKNFPKPGVMRELCAEACRERISTERLRLMPPINEKILEQINRPHCWWMGSIQTPEREAEIPRQELEAYLRWKYAKMREAAQ